MFDPDAFRAWSVKSPGIFSGARLEGSSGTVRKWFMDGPKIVQARSRYIPGMNRALSRHSPDMIRTRFSQDLGVVRAYCRYGLE